MEKFKGVIGGTFALDAIAQPLERVFQNILELELDVQWLPYGGLMESLKEVRKGPILVYFRVEDLFLAHPEIKAEYLKGKTDEMKAGKPVRSSVSSEHERVSANREKIEMLAREFGELLCSVVDRGVAIDVVSCRGPEISEMDREMAEEVISRVSGCRVRCCRDVDLGEEWYNRVGDLTMHQPFSAVASTALAICGVRFWVSRFAPPKKLVVLDCDGVLWDGVLGEDGDEVDVTMGSELRKRVEILRDEFGVFVGFATKNEPEDVLRAFEKFGLFSGMEVVLEAGWDVKSESIRRICAKFGVSKMEEVVFLDDSPAECDEVSWALPMVTVVQVQDFRVPWVLSDHVSTIVTVEDSKRAEMMEAEHRRREEAGVSLCEALPSAFQASLQLRVECRPVEERDVDRVVQLSRRTNQCTVWKRPVDEEFVRMRNEADMLRVIEVTDRFGHYGLVGCFSGVKVEEEQPPENISSSLERRILCGEERGEEPPPEKISSSLERRILCGEERGEEPPSNKQTSNTLFIDTLFLSCRVLGRGVEGKVLEHICRFARDRGCSTIQVAWLPSPRNEPARRMLTQALDGQFLPLHDPKVFTPEILVQFHRILQHLEHHFVSSDPIVSDRERMERYLGHSLEPRHLQMQGVRLVRSLRKKSTSSSAATFSDQDADSLATLISGFVATHFPVEHVPFYTAIVLSKLPLSIDQIIHFQSMRGAAVHPPKQPLSIFSLPSTTKITLSTSSIPTQTHHLPTPSPHPASATPPITPCSSKKWKLHHTIAHLLQTLERDPSHAAEHLHTQTLPNSFEDLPHPSISSEHDPIAQIREISTFRDTARSKYVKF